MNNAQRVVLVLFIFSLVATIATSGLLYFRLLYMWGILFVGSALWSAFSLRGLELRRSARSLRAQVGQVFEERYEIRNLSRLPHLWLEVTDESTLLGSRGSQVLTLIDSRLGRSYLARTRLRKRGVFALGPTRLSSGDLFGLFPVKRSFPAQMTLIVHPKLVEVPSFPNPPGLLSGGDALRRRTPHVTPNAAGVRDYAPGDPLNRIHWASTARRDRFMVKEFELDPLADVWIFYDASQEVQANLPEPEVGDEKSDFWLRDVDVPMLPSTEEYGVSIAASLARYFLQADRAVGLVAVGQDLVSLAPDRGLRQLGKILDALAMLRAEGNLPLQGLLEVQAPHLTQGASAIMVTASTNSELAIIADNLSRQGIRPVAVLIDPASFGAEGSNDELVQRFKLLGFPVRQVKEGDNLSIALAGSSIPTASHFLA